MSKGVITCHSQSKEQQYLNAQYLGAWCRDKYFFLGEKPSEVGSIILLACSEHHISRKVRLREYLGKKNLVLLEILQPQLQISITLKSNLLSRDTIRFTVEAAVWRL